MKNIIIIFAAVMTFFATTVNATTTNNDHPSPVIPAIFKGGEAAFENYIQENLVYPECAREKAVEGEVTISFFVLADGSIHGARVVKGIDEKCDQVALDVITNMPKWLPAQQGSKAMASKNYVKVNFQLEG